MTDIERIKSILAECEYGYIGYDNLHSDNDRGITLIAEALSEYCTMRRSKMDEEIECTMKTINHKTKACKMVKCHLHVSIA